MIALVLDTETTGQEEPEVVEVAWKSFRDPTDLSPEDFFHQCYKPLNPILLGAKAVHHITEKDVRDCPPSSSFHLPEGVEYIVGHNIDYDWKAIGQPDVRRIDTLAMARATWPDLDSHSLGALIYYLFPAQARKLLQDAHSAMVDVHNTIALLEVILLHTGVFDDWKQLWTFSEQCRLPRRMPFGKHKGEMLKDVPRSYRQWLFKQPAIDPYLLKAFELFG